MSQWLPCTLCCIVLCSGLAEQTSPDEVTLLQKTHQNETMTVSKPKSRGSPVNLDVGSGSDATEAQCGDLLEKLNSAARKSGLEIASEATVNSADAAVSTIWEVGAVLLEIDTLGKGWKVGAAVVSSVLGPFVATGVGAATEFLMPDPNNERIENLQQGVSCLNHEVQQLEKRVQKLEEKLNIRINQLRRRPLVKMVAQLSILSQDHTACSKFLWCARKETDKSLCFRLYYQNMRTCNAVALADQMQKETHYHFLRETQTEEWDQQEMLNLVLSAEWQSVKDLVGGYIAVMDTVMFDWNSLEEWAAALCIPRSGYEDVCSKEDEATIAESFQTYKRKIMEPWATKWMAFFEDLLGSTRSELFRNSPIKITKSVFPGGCVMEREATEYYIYWYERTGGCSCQCGNKGDQWNCYCCQQKKVRLFSKQYNCMNWGYKSQQELCGEDCYVPLFDKGKEKVRGLLKENGCKTVQCKHQFKMGVQPNGYKYQAEKDDCGWQCPEGKDKFTYTVMMDPIKALAIQGFTMAEAIKNRKINIPPYTYTAHKKSAYETSNTCPDGYITEDDEAECSSRAHQWCDNGFEHSGEWPSDPVGCFSMGAQEGTCTIWFNKLKSSNPTNPHRWKLCTKASMENDQ